MRNKEPEYMVPNNWSREVAFKVVEKLIGRRNITSIKQQHMPIINDTDNMRILLGDMAVITYNNTVKLDLYDIMHTPRLVCEDKAYDVCEFAYDLMKKYERELLDDERTICIDRDALNELINKHGAMVIPEVFG